MKTVAITAAATLSAVAFAPAANACEFDGLPGMHRFNPFLHDAKKSWPKVPPVAPIVQPQNAQNQDGELVIEDGAKTKVSTATNTQVDTTVVQGIAKDKTNDKETAT